ncbi:TetR/AcrR family transcriptional regulator [Lentzea sp. NPDC051213]|uniref:TetR/AcrR family transcriptional regulator n=1 Tax=Lentzea sp. NPDC051213 TaxID=3364126 RepID=UPI0037B41B44
MANESGVRPLRADAARNRRAVIDAARHAFAQNGVNASLEDVARAAGVGPGTLYRHFPTRNDLVLAVIEDGLAELHRLGVELLDDPDPLSALTRWLQAYIDQNSMYEGVARTFASPPPDGDERSSCRLALDVGAALIHRAVDADADDVRALASAIAWIDGQLPPDPERRARLLRMMLDGIRPR